MRGRLSQRDGRQRRWRCRRELGLRRQDRRELLRPDPRGRDRTLFCRRQRLRASTEVASSRTSIGTSAQTGVGLTLTVTVLDSGTGCAPYQNAQVDIWHCNAAGIYSDQASENTSTESWLRGYQMTGANGKVTFVTIIIPGWYSGRTTHIHLRLRSKYSTASSTSDGTNTTQLFFSHALQQRRPKPHHQRERPRLQRRDERREPPRLVR